MNTPSKQDILEKYRDKINADDFKLLIKDDLPSPAETSKSESGYEKMGVINGFIAWIKRNSTTGAVVVVLQLLSGYGSVKQGAMEVYVDAKRVCTPVVDYLGHFPLNTHFKPADRYMLVGLESQEQLPFKINEPHWVTVTKTTSTTSTTTTTTTTMPPHTGIAPSINLNELPSGSGLVPYNPEWEV